MSFGLLMVALMAAAEPRSARLDRESLVRARQLYNSQQYDLAIAAAEEARSRSGSEDAAALVSARAHLERFRRGADPADLVAAREQLKGVRPEALDPRDRVELVLGLGESLFLDDRFGAAAEILASALGRADALPPDARAGVLDWWASAMDRDAQMRPLADRVSIYRALVDRMSDELAQDPYSAPAAYWVAAASRALGDLDRAWSAAIAGWVRAAYVGTRSDGLRTDLDRLVQQAIIPERVRQMAVVNHEAEQAAAGLRAEWDQVKQAWP